MFLFPSVQNICFGCTESLLLKKAFLHHILDGFNAYDIFLQSQKLLFDHVCRFFFHLLVLLSCRRSSKTDGAKNIFFVKRDNRPVSLSNLHADSSASCIFYVSGTSFQNFSFFIAASFAAAFFYYIAPAPERQLSGGYIFIFFTRYSVLYIYEIHFIEPTDISRFLTLSSFHIPAQSKKERLRDLLQSLLPE